MLTLSTHVDLQAPVHCVWSVLLDFSNYPKWHPFVELAGTAVEGGTLAFTFRRRADATRRASATATIVRLEEEAVFAFRYGHRAFLLAEDRFALSEVNGKTRVTRVTEYRGFVPLVSGWAAKRRMKSLLDLPVLSLARYLESVNKPAAPAKTAPAKAAPVRSGFRQAPARRKRRTR